MCKRLSLNLTWESIYEFMLVGTQYYDIFF